MSRKSFRDLEVWQKAIKTVGKTYSIIRSLPREEHYCLCEQMRRSSVSIPSNIAEGQGRESHKEFLQFLSIARGSNSEIQTQLYLCIELGYVEEKKVQPIINEFIEIEKMLNRLISYVKNLT